MEGTKEKIMNLWDLVGQMDEKGAETFDMVAGALKIGYRLGMDAAARKQEKPGEDSTNEKEAG